MLHEYRKKKPIKAEQFDGSDEMIEKYGFHMAKVPPMVTDYDWYLSTERGEMVIKNGDWIISGDGEPWLIPDSFFCRAYERCD